MKKKGFAVSELSGWILVLIVLLIIIVLIVGASANLDVSILQDLGG